MSGGRFVYANSFLSDDDLEESELISEELYASISFYYENVRGVDTLSRGDLLLRKRRLEERQDKFSI